MASTSTAGYKCVLCSNSFPTKDLLQDHFRTHAKDRSLKEGQRSNLPYLSKDRAAPVSIKCDICSSEFTSNSAAIQHKFRKHPNSNDKHCCSTCGMSFPLKALLDRHIPSHEESGGQQHPKTENNCDVCGSGFDNVVALRYHYTTSHQRVMKLFQPIITAPPSKKIKINNAGDANSVYYCHLCGTEYIVKFNLQKHLETLHTEAERCETPTEMIKCTACEALFYNRKAYETHNIGHKPDDLYVTDEQQRLQLVKRIDQDFDVRRVQPLADRYVPTYRRRRTKYTADGPSKSKKRKKEEEQLSPPSTPEPSDSDSDSPIGGKIPTKS